MLLNLRRLTNQLTEYCYKIIELYETLSFIINTGILCIFRSQCAGLSDKEADEETKGCSEIIL